MNFPKLKTTVSRIAQLFNFPSVDYPIGIKWDSKMMLNSKVTTAKDHKREF